MALRAGYKGFKKLLPGLKIIRPGTLGIDNDVLIPELNKTFFSRSEQAVLGAKNLNVYPYNYSGTQTFGAVTAVFGDDGRITLNGTASANDNIIIHSRANYSSLVDKNPIILQKGTYKISRSTTGYDLRVVNTVSGSGNVLAILSGDSKEATFTLSDTSQVGIIIDITSGDEFINKVIDPMISFDGGVFVPYAMTNKELTEKVSVKTIAHATAITEGDLSVTFTEYITGNVEQIVGVISSSVDKDITSQSGISIGNELAHKPLSSAEIIGSIGSSLSASDRRPICSIRISNTGRIGIDGQMAANRSYPFTLTYIFND